MKQQVSVQENMIESNQYFQFKRQPSIVMERQATAVMGTKRPLQSFFRPSIRQSLITVGSLIAYHSFE